MTTLGSTQQIDFPVTATTGGERGTTILHRLKQAMSIRRQRHALLALDDRMLSDIGISRADVYREAYRPFLDLPENVIRHCR